MDSKENIISANNPLHAPFVKPEPQDQTFALLAADQPWHGVPDVKSGIKPEIDAGPEPFPEARAFHHDAAQNGAQPHKREEFNPVPVPPRAPERPFFTAHNSAAEIEYVPEDALKEGLGMVKALSANIKKLELGSKMRQDVWLREIESLQNQTTPSTMIAVCGATGAGKSSIMNAILDDNIVPTSGMRACTAVVTEIGYHNKKTIEGFVSFLTEHEWRQELSVLLDDLVDEDGNLKRITNDMRSEASVAWSKVHAVYPTITQEQLAKMSINAIIGSDINIAKMLGTTKHIVANDSKQFAKEIAKFIDSKDQKRGDKSKKDKAKEKDKGKSLMDRIREQNKKGSGSASGSKSKDDDENGPAYWPLIRQVQVKCNSRALSTGCILVDLPGVADANAARNNIAKDYMKKCDCIWVLAPITRAVDDKTARDLMGDAFKMQLMMDGNYDDNAITFIATKCDDISCTEVIRALQLEDDPELEQIEDEIDQCKTETQEWQERKAEAEEAAKAANENLQEIRPILAEYQAHLKALQRGEDFTPELTGKSKKQKQKEKSKRGDEDEDMSEVEELVGDDIPRGKKRKHSPAPKAHSSKKRRIMDDDDDDFLVDDDGELIFSDDDDDAKSSAHGPDTSDQGSDSEAEKDEDEDMNKSDDEEEEPVTEESLKAKIKEAQELVTQFRAELSSCREQRKTAMDALATLKKREGKAQRQKNAFCSRKRSEFSKDVLKEDFRVGLKDLDDAAAEQRDPDNFDPTINIRNYDAIDLPVFTCSARDYIRIKGQAKGDGDPSCFTKTEDTGVPALQEWCHHLTVSSRERAARNFLTHLKTFANSVKTYVEGVGDVTAADRESLRAKWESNLADMMDVDEPMAYDGGWPGSDDPFSIEGLAMLADPRARAGLYAVDKKPKVNKGGDLVGVTPRLIKEFANVVDDCVHDLQERFKDGLEEKCRIGATNAAAAAVETHDTFAYKSGIHWATYRATLRRHGCWRGDLNVELSNPFTRQIASTWSKVFEGDLFAAFEQGTNDAIRLVLKEVEDSAAPGLKERARGTVDMSLNEARTALKKTIELVRETINTEQKEVSRLLSPHVMNQLAEGYDLAMMERGTGSVARQKRLFSEYIGDKCKNDQDNMFEGAADIILERLAGAAEAVGKTLGDALEKLAEKVEVSVAVLWEGHRDDPTQVRARAEVVTNVAAIIEEVQRWQQAAELKAAAAEPVARPADA